MSLKELEFVFNIEKDIWTAAIDTPLFHLTAYVFRSEARVGLIQASIRIANGNEWNAYFESDNEAVDWCKWKVTSMMKAAFEDQS